MEGNNELPVLGDDNIYPHEAPARNLVDAILGKAENISPATHGLAAMEVIEAACQSVENRQPGAESLKTKKMAQNLLDIPDLDPPMGDSILLAHTFGLSFPCGRNLCPGSRARPNIELSILAFSRLMGRFG